MQDPQSSPLQYAEYYKQLHIRKVRSVLVLLLYQFVCVRFIQFSAFWFKFNASWFKWFVGKKYLSVRGTLSFSRGSCRVNARFKLFDKAQSDSSANVECVLKAHSHCCDRNELHQSELNYSCES